MQAGGLDKRRVAQANRLGFVGFGLMLVIVSVGLQELHRLRVTSQELKTSIHNADFERIAILINAGADVRTRDRNGRSSLHVAASFGNEGLVRTLLKRGHDPNARTKGGVTPLMAATPRGQLGVIALLVAAGADVDQRDQNGQSAVFYAVMANQPDVVGQLSARYHARLDVTDNKGLTILSLARRCRFHQIVRLLKHQGVRE